MQASPLTQFALNYYGDSNSFTEEDANNLDQSRDIVLPDMFRDILFECDRVMRSESSKLVNRDLAVYVALCKLQANHPELHDNESVSQMLIKIAENVLRNFSEESQSGEGYEPLFDMAKIPSEAVWLTLKSLAYAMTYPAFYEVEMLKEIVHRLQPNNDNNHIAFISLVAEIERCSKDKTERDFPLLAKICMQVFKVGEDYRPRDQEAKDACIALAEQVKRCGKDEKLVTALLVFVGVVPTPVLAPAPLIHQTTASDIEAEARIRRARIPIEFGKLASVSSPAAAEFYACLAGMADSDLRIAPLLQLARACLHAISSPLAEHDHLLLTQIYLQTTRLINEPTTRSHIGSYLVLAESAKHCHEGRKLATAMLAVAGATLLTSVFLSAGFIALPLLTSHLLAQCVTTAVGVAALYKGLSFFKDAYTQHSAMKEVSAAMVPVVRALRVA